MWYGLLLWIFFDVVVVWSLTAIATVNCHSMGKNSRKKYRLHAGFGRVNKHGRNINFGWIICWSSSVFASTPPLTVSHSLSFTCYLFLHFFIAVSLFTFPLLSRHSLSQSLFGSLIYSSIHPFINSTSCPSLPYFTHSLSSFSRVIRCLSSSSLLSISLACWSSCTVSIRSSRRFLGDKYT